MLSNQQMMLLAVGVLGGYLYYSSRNKSEKHSNYIGDEGCFLAGSPVFPSGTRACQIMQCCEDAGGGASYTSHGYGGQISCSQPMSQSCLGYGSISVDPNGNELRRRRPMKSPMVRTSKEKLLASTRNATR